MSFILNTAWRDSRRNIPRLLLFISSIISGIAALVAINTFSENLQKDINGQAKTLLGADMMLEGTVIDTRLTDTLALLTGGEQSDVVSFASMVYFPGNGGTRLAQVKAVEGNYPFFGTVRTDPENSYSLLQKEKPVALLDKILMIQFNLKTGDSVRVGNITLPIAAQVISVPGRAGLASSVAPSVFIPMQSLESTGLLQKGSRIERQSFFKIPDGFDVTAFVDSWKPALDSLDINCETVEGRKEASSEAFSSMSDFLNLVAFIALLLGCIGVASAVHLYIQEKIPAVAILRCLGVSGRQAFAIYLVQILGLGLIGAVIGAALGSLIQVTLPFVVKDFLPIEDVSSDISWSAIGNGILTGFSVALLFSLLPLWKIRHTSPLLTLRASYEEEETAIAAGNGFFKRTFGSSDWRRTEGVRWIIRLLIACTIGLFAWIQSGDWRLSLSFLVGIGATLGILALTGWLLIWLVRRFFPKQWSYVWRQGVANLFRPKNQTVILMVSIGLGTFLVATLFFVQDLLLSQISFAGGQNQPNMILFDIQSAQKDSVAALTRSFDLPVLQEVPIVTMKLESLNGISRLQHLRDTSSEISNWVYDREWRVTYRDTLIETEKIVEGKWYGEKKGDTIFVSVASNVAKDMQIKPGDPLTFNVQGAMVKTYVGSIREVNFRRIQTNFLILFPRGVLEAAPQFNVIITKVPSEEKSARFQQALVQQYPNISAIDLTQILRTVDDVLSKVSFVIRFMAIFSILTGLLVLLTSVMLSRLQRVKESVLLRTLGASKRQIFQINALEYLLLGFFATFTGVLLAIAASYLLARFVFEAPFAVIWWPALLLMAVIIGIILLTGLSSIRRIVRQSPLEVLRNEG